MYTAHMSWRDFDIKHDWSRPQPGQLVALRMVSKRTGTVSYQVGELYNPDHLKAQGKRKLWWKGQGVHLVSDPLKMQKEYDIWWCPLPL